MALGARRADARARRRDARRPAEVRGGRAPGPRQQRPAGRGGRRPAWSGLRASCRRLAAALRAVAACPRRCLPAERDPASSRTLRAAGLAADLGAVLDFARALRLVDIGDRDEVKAAGAALFVRRREDLAPYEIVFDRFWRRRHPPARPPSAPVKDVETDAAPTQQGEGRVDRPEARRARGGGRGSRRGRGRRAGHRARRLQRRRSAPPPRLRPDDPVGAARGGRLIDRIVPAARHAADAALGAAPPGHGAARHGRCSGATWRPAATRSTWLWRRPARRPRSVVLICDISGSMERHARLLLRFGQALARSEVRTEAFVLRDPADPGHPPAARPRPRPGADPGRRHASPTGPAGRASGPRSTSSTSTGRAASCARAASSSSSATAGTAAAPSWWAARRPACGATAIASSG